MVLIALVGCASTSTQVGTFSKAAEELVTQLEKGYQLVEQTTIQRKIVDAAADPSIVLEDEMFTGFFKGSENYKVRMKMLRLLRNYSKALGVLSSTGLREGVDRACKDLYGTLTGLKAAYEEAANEELDIKDKDLSGFATIINAMGTVVVEKKRRKAIKKVVKMASAPIQKICTYIKAELPDYKDLVMTNLSTFIAEMKNYYLKEGASLNFEERLNFLEKIQQKHRQEAETGKFFDRLGRAVSRLAKTHDALLKATEKRDFTNKELIKQIGALANEAKSFKAFYKDLIEDN